MYTCLYIVWRPPPALFWGRRGSEGPSRPAARPKDWAYEPAVSTDVAPAEAKPELAKKKAPGGRQLPLKRRRAGGVYMYVYDTYIDVYGYNVYSYVYMYMCLVYVYVYMYAYIHLYIHIYICMYVCMYVCVQYTCMPSLCKYWVLEDQDFGAGLLGGFVLWERGASTG